MFDDFIVGPQSDEFYDEFEDFEDEEYLDTLAYQKAQKKKKMRKETMSRYDEYIYDDRDEDYFPKYDW